MEWSFKAAFLLVFWDRYLFMMLQNDITQHHTPSSSLTLSQCNTGIIFQFLACYHWDHTNGLQNINGSEFSCSCLMYWIMLYPPLSSSLQAPFRANERNKLVFLIFFFSLELGFCIFSDDFIKNYTSPDCAEMYRLY